MSLQSTDKKLLKVSGIKRKEHETSPLDCEETFTNKRLRADDTELNQAYLHESPISFTLLPCAVQILIARELSLKDAIAYSQVCTVTHDAVYYVFAHRECLDFASLVL